MILNLLCFSLGLLIQENSSKHSYMYFIESTKAVEVQNILLGANINSSCIFPSHSYVSKSSACTSLQIVIQSSQFLYEYNVGLSSDQPRRKYHQFFQNQFLGRIVITLISQRSQSCFMIQDSHNCGGNFSAHNNFELCLFLDARKPRNVWYSNGIAENFQIMCLPDSNQNFEPVATRIDIFMSSNTSTSPGRSKILQRSFISDQDHLSASPDISAVTEEEATRGLMRPNSSRNLLSLEALLQTTNKLEASLEKSAAGLVIATMTTSPSRLSSSSSSLHKCIANLLSIPLIDVLYLNVPWAYTLRTKTGNITIPIAIQKLAANSSNRFRVNRCTDYGPATKLLPLLQLPDDVIPPDAMLITFDDDRIYTPQAVQALVSAAVSKPDSVITIAAWGIHILSAGGLRGKPNGPVFRSPIAHGDEGRQYAKAGPVDLILGFYGVLYRKKFFLGYKDIFDYAGHVSFSRHCSWVDDVWFSGHLERLKIPRFVIGNVPETRADITDLSNVQALSLDRGVSVKQNHDNVLCAEAMSIVYGVWDRKRSHVPPNLPIVGDTTVVSAGNASSSKGQAAKGGNARKTGNRASKSRVVD